MAKRVVDCHVNVWEDKHVLPLYHQQLQRVRPGAMQDKADADTLYEAMADADKAIIFSLRYGDSSGIDGDDEVTAAAVKKYPDKFVGFACMDPRRPDYLELLRHAVEDLGLKGVKFGPIYNGVHALRRPGSTRSTNIASRTTCRSPSTWARPTPATRRSSSAAPSMSSRSRYATPISSIDHGAYGPPLVRGVHRRHAQAAERLSARSRRSTTGPGSTTTS